MTRPSPNTPISNITFQRCNGVFIFTTMTDYGQISNIKIISSVITQLTMSGEDIPLINLQVYNCIVNYVNLSKSTTTASFINCVSPSPNITGNIIVFK